MAAWIDAIPGYPNSHSEYDFRFSTAIIADQPVVLSERIVEWLAWSPDGSALA